MKKLIKKLLITVLIIAPVFGALAQEPTTSLGVEEFEVNGIKVLLKHSPKEIISAKLYIRGGTANYTKEKEGIENFALNLAVTGGTKSMDKFAFSNASDKIGVRISVNSDYDFSQINLTCVKQFWDESWSLFTDAILNPSFSQEEYALLKEKLINNAKQISSSPDSFDVSQGWDGISAR